MGLGNPGPEYVETRHNAGFRLADQLAARWAWGGFGHGEHARATHGLRDGRPVTILKPQTYMNRSGAALEPLRARPDFDPSADLLVLVDDVALPIGTFRLRGAGSAGGHNGLKSIEGALQRQDYARLRIGVGPVPPGLDDLADFVLGRFTAEDCLVLEPLFAPMIDAVECWLAEGIERAMSRFNR